MKTVIELAREVGIYFAIPPKFTLVFPVAEDFAEASRARGVA